MSVSKGTEGCDQRSRGRKMKDGWKDDTVK